MSQYEAKSIDSGRRLSGAPEPCSPQKSVERESERQARVLEECELKMERLVNVLDPVLAHKTELKAVNQSAGRDVVSAGCGIATSIAQRTDRIIALSNTVGDILDRLEI